MGGGKKDRETWSEKPWGLKSAKKQVRTNEKGTGRGKGIPFALIRGGGQARTHGLGNM